MKYALVFAGFAVGLFWSALRAPSPWAIALLWPGISCTVLAYAYASKQPKLIFGKQSSGRISGFWMLLNLPWLLLTGCTWLLLALCSREPAVHRLEGSHISIARWPIFGVDLSEFDVVIDLAAEFPRIYRLAGKYESLPNLDGVPLSNSLNSIEINGGTKVLVHCAQGHGRSASFAALLLGRLGLATSAEAALLMILKSRPLAKMSTSQMTFVASNFGMSGGTES